VSNRLIVRDLLVLTIVALGLRTAAALLVPWPPYTDAAYYDMVAQQLATGHGFSAPIIWSFLEVGSRIPANPSLPVPSNGHWMPLTSVVAAGSMAVLGPGWRGGQVPMVLLASALVPITYLVGWQFWHSRTVALGGATLALLGGPLLIAAPLVANYAVFGVTGAGALYASCRAVQAPRSGPWLLGAGLTCGLATLTRVDGLLLTIAPATAWLLRLQRGGMLPALGWGLGSAGAFTLVLAPWLLHNLATFGAPLPSAGAHMLWISSYNEQFSIGHEISLSSYLATTSPLAIVGSRLAAWGELIARSAALTGGIFIIFFAAGLWLTRRRRELLPFIVYFVAMFLVMGAVFTFHGPKGAFYHSSAAWLPFALPMSVAAIAPASTFASRWWRFLGRPATHRFLLVVGIIGALVLSLAASASLYAEWTASRRLDEAAGSYFISHDLTHAVVMSDDPAALWQVSHNPGVPFPFDPYPVIDRVINAYDVDWVVVTRRDPSLPDPLGLWDGGESVDAQGNRATFLPSTPVFETGGVRIYRVIR
jgi:hypothetical protein